jgi:hypothetical protein
MTEQERFDDYIKRTEEKRERFSEQIQKNQELLKDEQTVHNQSLKKKDLNLVAQ